VPALRLFRYLLGRGYTIVGTFREGGGCDSPGRADPTYQNDQFRSRLFTFYFKTAIAPAPPYES